MTNLKVLELSLHGYVVGHLVKIEGGPTALHIDERYRDNVHRPSLTLTSSPRSPNIDQVLADPFYSSQRIHPLFSNLLPEGALRQHVAQKFKLHEQDEFSLLSSLGRDLPGAFIATPVSNVTFDLEQGVAINVEDAIATVSDTDHHFSLAGVQLKFSLLKSHDRYTYPSHDELGDWIVKTPSITHPHVPSNEYTVMRLAEAVGVNVPDIKMVPLDKLDGVSFNRPEGEGFAYAIKRFDREAGQRVHMEDFAQVLMKYPHDKYDGGNYDQIGRYIYQYSSHGREDVQQYARRLLVNILLANGDAHLKNWSMYYPDKINARLAPAYDIVMTSVYMRDEDKLSLNLAKKKRWYDISMATFEYWAQRVDIPWRYIKPHLDEVMMLARAHWQEALTTLPMLDEHKDQLRLHWQRLHPDFSIPVN